MTRAVSPMQEVADLFDGSNWNWNDWVERKDQIVLAVVDNLVAEEGWATIGPTMHRLEEVGAPYLAWQDAQTVRNAFVRLTRRGLLVEHHDGRRTRWTTP